MNPIKKDPLQRRLEIQNWILLGILVVIGFVVISDLFALGVLCGGLLSIANFYGLYLNLKKAFLQVSDRTKAFMMVRYFIRFALTGVVLYFLITRTPVNIFGLIIGLSVVVINIVFTTLVELSKKNIILRTKEVE